MRGKRRIGLGMAVVAIVVLIVSAALVLFVAWACKSASSVAGDAETAASRQAEERSSCQTEDPSSRQTKSHGAVEKAQTVGKDWGESWRGAAPKWSEADSRTITNEMRWLRGRSRHERSLD